MFIYVEWIVGKINQKYRNHIESFLCNIIIEKEFSSTTKFVSFKRENNQSNKRSVSKKDKYVEIYIFFSYIDINDQPQYILHLIIYWK